MRLRSEALLLLIFAISLVAAEQESAPPDISASTLSPEAVGELAVGLTSEQAAEAVTEWGLEQKTAEQRIRAALSGALIGSSVRYSIAQARHTSTAYTRCNCTGIVARTRHAIMAEFQERRANGTDALPIARFAGIYTSALASTSQQPGSFSPMHLMSRSGAAIGSDIADHLAAEFMPDIRRRLLRPLYRLRTAVVSSRPQPRP